MVQLIFRTILSSAFVFMFAGYAVASNVKCELSLHGGKTQFRSGDPILLDLTFVADKAGVTINVTTTEPLSPVDIIDLMPMQGVHPGWRSRLEVIDILLTMRGWQHLSPTSP